MPSEDSADQALRLVWQLRDDPEALHNLQTVPGLSVSVGGMMPAAPGPPVGSPDWWNAIEASSAAALAGVIDEVRPRAGAHGEFKARTKEGAVFEGQCRGGADNYWEGSKVEVVRSFPPPGFVHPGRLDGDGGVVTEIWVDGDE